MNPGRERGSVRRGVISHFVNATACSDVWAWVIFFPLEEV